MFFTSVKKYERKLESKPRFLSKNAVIAAHRRIYSAIV